MRFGLTVPNLAEYADAGLLGDLAGDAGRRRGERVVPGQPGRHPPEQLGRAGEAGGVPRDVGDGDVFHDDGQVVVAEVALGVHGGQPQPAGEQ